MVNSSTKNAVSKSEVKELFNKPVVRAFVHGLVDAGLVVYTALVPIWTGVTITILITLGILDVLVIVYYGAQSVNYRATIDELQKNNDLLLKHLHGYEDLVKRLEASTVDGPVYPDMGHIQDVGYIVEQWNFESYCQDRVKAIFDQIKSDIKSPNNQIEVSYINVLHDEDNNSSQIQAIACSTDELCRPSIFNRIRDLDTDPYLDAEYVLRDNPKIQCITSHDEVRLRMQNRRQIWKFNYDLDKYNQLFFVPVLYPDRNIVGVLVITCLNGTVLADNNEKAERYILTTIVPYLKVVAAYYGLSGQPGNEV